MSNFLTKYYEGVTQQLRAEVELMNELITMHNGLKGTGNENALRELLTKFLPKRFGIDTGMVIDRTGQVSKQIDVIIYDCLEYPSLYTLGGIHLFPVDNVYATIEVKTTLDAGAAREARENAASVLKLPLAPIHEETIVWFPPPEPPLATVFAYSSNTSKGRPLASTVKGWFELQDSDDVKHAPSLVACLDQGLLARGNYFNLEEKEMKLYLVPLLTTKPDGSTDVTILDTMPKTGTFSDDRGFMYPVIKHTEDKHDRYFPIDPARILMHFLFFLSDALVQSHAKRLQRPTVTFSYYYLPEELRKTWSI